MRSVHRAVGTCPTLAFHIADVHGNSLERTSLATSPALPAPNCCMFSSPSLPWPPHSCFPLHPHAEIAAPCCFSSARDADLLWSLGRGPWGLKVRSCAVSPPHRLWLGKPRAATDFHRGSFEGLNTFVG